MALMFLCKLRSVLSGQTRVVLSDIPQTCDGRKANDIDEYENPDKSLDDIQGPSTEGEHTVQQQSTYDWTQCSAYVSITHGTEQAESSSMTTATVTADADLNEDHDAYYEAIIW